MGVERTLLEKLITNLLIVVVQVVLYDPRKVNFEWFTHGAAVESEQGRIIVELEFDSAIVNDQNMTTKIDIVAEN